MLQELLLSLSGHPSTLLPLISSRSSPAEKDNVANHSFSAVLSSAELALLTSLSTGLGQKHQIVRSRAIEIATPPNRHPSSSTRRAPERKDYSSVSRAVATSILETHLAAFQARIVEVESQILEGNSLVVGARGTVPLSAVVRAFDGWKGKMKWLERCVALMTGDHRDDADAHDANEAKRQPCTAAELIDWLRQETRTGFPDIAQMVTELVGVAEAAWLRQVAAWVLYGRHPGADDFLVHTITLDSGHSSGAYEVRYDMTPQFVTQTTARSILFVGTSLLHIKERRDPKALANEESMTFGSSSPEVDLLQPHLKMLSELKSPISPAAFTAAVRGIRSSLSQNALQKLLPLSAVLEVLSVCKNYFLLDRGEFAVALITAAEERLLGSRARKNATKSRGMSSLGNHLAGLTIKEGEVHAVLTKAWAALVSLQAGDEDEVDDEVDQARGLIRLAIKSVDDSKTNGKAEAAGSPSFDDLLLPSPTVLSLRISSPLDLFLTTSDVDTYSCIHAYLLAIRRAHFRLSQLFLLSHLRRHHPSPKPTSTPDSLLSIRYPNNRRNQSLRPVWASISSTSTFLTHLGEYLHGEVIPASWTAFHHYLDPSSQSRPSSSSSHKSAPATQAPKDPQTMSSAHSVYLSTLSQSLLLTHTSFTRPLRCLMTATDLLVGLMRRLDTVCEVYDASPSSAHSTEEKDVVKQMLDVVPKLKDGVSECLVGLEEAMETDTKGKAGSTRYDVTGSVVDRAGTLGGVDEEELDFRPWTPGRQGLEKLIGRW